MSRRPLHFIWILDCSASMNAEGKIRALNAAITEALPLMRAEAARNTRAELLVRAITFSAGARWHVEHPTPVADFEWDDVEAAHDTNLGAALQLVGEALKMPPMPNRALPPVLVLVSDGRPTDRLYEQRLEELLQLDWGKRAIRVAVAIGRDADYEVLQNFIGDDNRAPLQANSPEDLVELFRWVTTAVVKRASQPTGKAGTSRDPLFRPPPPTNLRVWRSAAP
jgi:uncharacterized protein YegL